MSAALYDSRKHMECRLVTSHNKEVTASSLSAFQIVSSKSGSETFDTIGDSDSVCKATGEEWEHKKTSHSG